MRRLNCLEVVQSVTGSNPQLSRAIAANLEKEHRVIGIATSRLLVGNFLAGEFGHFPDNPSIQSVLRCALGYIAQNFNFSRKPGIAAALNIVGDEAVQQNEDQHGCAGKSQRGPQRDTPRGAAHYRLSRL